MSKPVVVTIPHNLGRTEARRRIDEGVHKLAAQLGGGGAGAMTQSWQGDRLNFSVQAMGQTVTGLVDVLEDGVKLEVILPGFLAMIANKIKGKLQTEGQILLEDPKKR